MLNKIKKNIRNPNILKQKIYSRLPYYLASTRAFNPGTVFLNINSICNAKCKMCDIGQKNIKSQFYKNLIGAEKEIEINKLKRIVDQIKFFNPEIKIVATEPLLHSHLIEFIRYVRKNGLKISLTTNGILLPTLAEKLVQAGLSELCLSQDGLEQVCDEIRGVAGTFKNGIQGIKIIHDLKQKKGLNYPKIHINYTITNINDDCLYDYLVYVRSLGYVDHLCFSHLNFITREMAERHNKEFKHFCSANLSSVMAIDPKKVSIDNIWNNILEIKAEMKNKKNRKMIVEFLPEMNSKKLLYDFYFNHSKVIKKKACLVPWSSASIDVNGNMIILARCMRYVVGNIFEQDFKHIWNNDKYKRFRKMILKHKMFPACTRCCGVL